MEVEIPLLIKQWLDHICSGIRSKRCRVFGSVWCLVGHSWYWSTASAKCYWSMHCARGFPLNHSLLIKSFQWKQKRIRRRIFIITVKSIFNYSFPETSWIVYEWKLTALSTTRLRTWDGQWTLNNVGESVQPGNDLLTQGSVLSPNFWLMRIYN